MSPADLLAPFAVELQQAKRVFVGFSGGLDSTLLLQAAVDLLGSKKICALHVNHQLQSEANFWQEHCRLRAQNLDVEFRDTRLEVVNQGKGIENQARELRYRFFEQQLQAGDVLLLGHQMDDQAETLLYRLVRGAGVRGLSAIPEQRSIAQARLLRPLLGYSRQTLLEIAAQQQLEWIEDPSNQDVSYDRNYLRSKVLPVILERWPSATTTLARTANNLSTTLQLLDEYGDFLLLDCDWRQESWGRSFDLARFVGLSSAAQVHLLNTAFRQLQLRGFDAQYHDRVLALIESREDKTPLVKIGDSELRRFGNRLYLMPEIASFPATDLEIPWTGREVVQIAGCGSLASIPDYRGGTLQIKFRQGGERCKPLGRDKSQSLKKVMQEHQLEPWLRGRVPLIYRDGEIAAVAGLFSCATDIITPGFEWQLA